MAWKIPKMISAAKTSHDPAHAGFSLLEIVIVLAIAAVILGGAVGRMVYSSDERVIRNTSGEIELLAKRARTMAILHQAPYALEFRQKQVRILPYAEAGEDERRKIRGREIGGAVVKDAEESENEIQLPAEMQISIRRWNADKWLPTGKDTVHVWRFNSDGLCEPISVRMALENSQGEDDYHPLTATIRDSRLDAK